MEAKEFLKTLLSDDSLLYFTECAIFISGLSLGIIIVAVFGQMKFKKFQFIKRVLSIIGIWIGWHFLPVPVLTYALAFLIQPIARLIQ